MGWAADDPIWARFDVREELPAPVASPKGPARCFHCGEEGRGLLTDGVVMCQKCNTVIDRFLDHAAEWRFFAADDVRVGNDVTRCGPPANELIPTFGSFVSGYRNWRQSKGPANCACISGVSSSIVPRYQMWNSLTYRQRTLCGVFELLSVSAAQFGLPACILEEAKTMYKRMTDGRILRGSNRSAMVASSVYMSCKSNHVPRSVKEVADMFDVSVKALNKSCRLFESVISRDMGSCTPMDFVARFCSRLQLDETVVAVCRKVVVRGERLSLVCESTPPTFAAGAIQLVNAEMGLGVERAALAEACLTSWVTILKCYKRLQPHKEALLSASAAEPPSAWKRG